MNDNTNELQVDLQTPETMLDLIQRRSAAIASFRKQGKKGIMGWLQNSPCGGIVSEGIMECFRASIESADGTWKVHYNRPHTNAPVAPPPKGSMDFIPVSAACLTGVLILHVDGQVYPGPNFPRLPEARR